MSAKRTVCSVTGMAGGPAADAGAAFLEPQPASTSATSASKAAKDNLFRFSVIRVFDRESRGCLDERALHWLQFLCAFMLATQSARPQSEQRAHGKAGLCGE